MAGCGSIPKTVVFRKTWSIACCWTSPPGVPKGMKRRPPVNAIAVAGGRHLGPRPLLDEPLPRRRVRLREEAVGGDLHEVRIAVVRIAIREGELDRLDEPVQVRRRVVAEGLQIDAVEEVEHFQQ